MNEDPGPGPAAGASEPGAGAVALGQAVAEREQPPVKPEAGVGAPAPRRRSGRRIALLVGGVLAGLTAMATVVTLVAVFLVIPWWHASSPDWLAKTAIDQLDDAKALRYRGSFVDDVGRSVRMDVQAGGEDNQSVGWQEIDGHRAEFISSRAGTYLKADAAYWNIANPIYAPLYNGRWAKVSVGALRMLITPWLLPGSLAESLRKRLVTGDDKLVKSSAPRVRGVRAVRVTAPGQGGVHVMKSSPYRLLRVEGMVLGGARHGLNDYALDVEPLDPAAVRAFDARFAALPKTMASAIDVEEEKTWPAYYVIDDQSPGKPQCTLSNCRIFAMVRNQYGPARPGEQHRLIGVLREGRGGTNGRVLGRCELVLPPMARDKPAKVSCVVRDARWARWAVNPANDWFSWEFTTFNPDWEGTDLAVATKLFEDGIDKDLDEVAWEEGGALGVQVFARLIKVPGLKPATAIEIIRQATALERLDVLGRYAGSGRVGDAAGLSAVLAGMKIGSDRRSTYKAEVRNAALSAEQRLAEATARAGSGTGPVALGSWTPPGAKAPAGLADVLDLGRKEAVQVSAVSEPGDRAVLAAITKAAQGFGKAPAGYRHVVQVQVADSRNPLRALDKGELRAALKKLGLTQSGLKGVQQLVIVTGTGRHTFAPGDFR